MHGEDSTQLLSGNEAIALGARHAGVTLGTGYPGTPSTEILEHFAQLGGRAQWAPNEKVAAEVALGVSFANGRALVTMKHVGLNVASDVLYTIAYSGVQGGYVLVSADDPGLASSQNEQDSRRHALAAGVPCLEPADAQDAYELTKLAFEISERWQIPVLLRVTTRVCHSHSLVRPGATIAPPRDSAYTKRVRQRVMIPAHARPAHRELRRKLRDIAAWNDSPAAPVLEIEGARALGVITAGVSFHHAREAAPDAAVLKLGLTHPLPFARIAEFINAHDRCIVVEENDPILVEQIRAAGGLVPRNPESFRFGELDAARVRKLIAGDASPDAAPPRAKPPELCAGCPHRATFTVLKEKNLIVAGDIGCYTLAALPPLEAMDTQLCMGAGIGVGLGLRHTLPAAEARRVVSVIGDSTFVHSGLTGIAEMVYNPPPNGHVVVVLDNGTTAMTGLQEHPATGRSLEHRRTGRVVIEEVCRALGVGAVHVVNPLKDAAGFSQLLDAALARDALTVLVARQPCILAAAKIRQYENAIAEAGAAGCACGCNGDAAAESTAGANGKSNALTGAPNGAARPSFARAINVKIAGLGGMGVLSAANVLAQVAFRAGCDVKKAEVHGMSQRGGSVCSDVRFGAQVHSPMIPPGEIDFLVALDEDWKHLHAGELRPGGVMIAAGAIDAAKLSHAKALNVALLGALSRRLPEFPETAWLAALDELFPEKLRESNRRAFELGRAS